MVAYSCIHLYDHCECFPDHIGPDAVSAVERRQTGKPTSNGGWPELNSEDYDGPHRCSHVGAVDNVFVDHGGATPAARRLCAMLCAPETCCCQELKEHGSLHWSKRVLQAVFTKGKQAAAPRGAKRARGAGGRTHAPASPQSDVDEE